MKKISLGLLCALFLTLLVGCSSSTTAALTATDYMDLGYQYLSELNYEEAILAFEKAIEIDPMLVEAYIGAAAAYTAQDDPETAQEILLQGVDAILDQETDNDLAIVLLTDAMTLVRLVVDDPEGDALPALLDWAFEQLNNVLYATEVYDSTGNDVTFGGTDGTDGTSGGTDGTSDGSDGTDQEADAVTFTWSDFADGVANHLAYVEGMQGSSSLEDITAVVYFNTGSGSYVVHIDSGELSTNFLTEEIVFSGEDLAQLPNLTSLTIEYFTDYNNGESLAGYVLEDISFLSELTSLTELVLGRNNISDLSPLANLTNLEHLELRENQIADLSPLAGLTNLTYLSLMENQIVDVTPLAGLTNLTHLDLSINQISDANCLASLVNAAPINLAANAFTSTAGVSQLPSYYGLVPSVS